LGTDHDATARVAEVAPPAGAPVAGGLDYAGPALRSSPGIPWLGLALLCAVAGLVLWGLLTPSISRPTGRALRSKCLNNLRVLGTAVRQYAAANGGRLPGGPADLVTTGLVSPDAFVCPASGGEGATGATAAEVAAKLSDPLHLTYVYAGKGLVNPPNSAVLFYEPLAHHSKGSHVLFAHGEVEWLSAKAAGKLVAELQAGFNPPRP
jgi:hypothetical protein